MSKHFRPHWIVGPLRLPCLAAFALGTAFLSTSTIPAQNNAQAVNPDQREFTYKQLADGQELKIYMIPPANWSPSDQLPAFVFFHGGGWVGGHAKPADRKLIGLAARGIVCFSVDYRLLDKNATEPPTVCMQDAKSALRWVRTHAKELGIDPNRIAAAGGSAGGHLAAFLGLMEGFDDPQDDLSVSAKPEALVLLSPVVDNGPDGFGYQRVGERFKEFSPFYHVSADAPPTIILVGGQDKLVPEKMIREFQSRMKSVGVHCELHLYPGEGHADFLSHSATVFPEIEKFLESLGWIKEAKKT